MTICYVQIPKNKNMAYKLPMLTLLKMFNLIILSFSYCIQLSSDFFLQCHASYGSFCPLKYCAFPMNVKLFYRTECIGGIYIIMLLCFEKGLKAICMCMTDMY